MLGVIIIIGILGVILILGVAYYMYKKKSTTSTTSSTPTPTSTTPTAITSTSTTPSTTATTPPEPYKPVCDSNACNAFMYNNILVKDREFQTGDDTPCRGCYPYLHYSWTPDHGLAVHKGVGWVSCGTKEKCYAMLAR